MSEYIRKIEIDTNECPNKYSWPIHSNIEIIEYTEIKAIKNVTILFALENTLQSVLAPSPVDENTSW